MTTRAAVSPTLTVEVLAQQLSRHRVAVYTAWVAVLVGGCTMLATFHAYAVAPAEERLARLEQRSDQAERDRTDVLVRLERLDDRLGRVGAAVSRVERGMGRR